MTGSKFESPDIFILISYGYGDELKVEFKCDFKKQESIDCFVPVYEYFILSGSTSIRFIYAVVGQYVSNGEEHNGHLYYEQMGSPFYLFYGDDSKWYGSRTLGDTNNARLYNPHPDPRDGWKFTRGNDSVTLSLSPGPLTPCRLRVLLTGGVAAKFAECQGEFTENGKWCRGKPKYSNSIGSRIWFCYNSLRIEPPTWSDARIDADTDEDIICPATVTKWKWTSYCYGDNVKWNHAEVSITCSNRNH